LIDLYLGGNSIGDNLINDIQKLVDANKNCKPSAAVTTMDRLFPRKKNRIGKICQTVERK